MPAPAAAVILFPTAPSLHEGLLDGLRALGFSELVRVRLQDGGATPLASPDGGGLVSAVRADGYVLVPDGSEGMDAGTTVSVYLIQ